MNKWSLIFACFLLAFKFSFGQDFSNKGKDFWLGYGYHVRYVTSNGAGGTNGQEMVLYFATENTPGTVTNIKVEIPALGYVENITNVPAGTIATSAPLPKTGSQDARLVSEGLFNRGIHVTSDRPVVAYAHIYNGNVSGATLLFPTNTLGKDYYSINYKQISNENFSNSFFFVVAADTGVTTVEITPSAATQNRPANVPFQITMNQGEIYNVMGELTGGSNGNFTGADLTGSRIRSVSANGVGCKRIAVFSGSGKIKISCSNSNSSDNLIAQAFPKTAWGKRFLTVPTQNMPNNYFRIAVADPSTIVRVNGTPITGLISNFYYDLPITNQPQLIEADQQIMVAQYITTASTCGNTQISNGDPDMIYLSPTEQTIDQVLLNSTSNFAISQHWINVVIKTAAVPSFQITGAIGTPSFQLHPQDPAFSYAQISVNAGTHTLSADSGFNAVAYGYGSAESYAYNAGTNLRDLYNFITPYNPLNISGQNTACACTPFYFTITYPFQPTSLFWDFKGFQTPNVTVNNPVADSVYQINGRQVWRYKLPTPYSYCPAGNYPISITAGTAGTDGCGNFQVKDDTLFVKNTPVPEFSFTSSGCINDLIQFNDNTQYEAGTFSYKWFWDFGDGTTSTDQAPTHSYTLPGTYTVKFSMVTNIGCISSEASNTITVTNKPVANFGIIPNLCEDKPIVFSDSSVVFAPSAIRNWYWNYGDGIKDTLTRNSNVQHTYSNWGPYTATLQVATPSGCLSNVFSNNFVVHPTPLAAFNPPAVVCLPYQSALFTNTSSIADGSEPSLSYRWIFGHPASGLLDTAITTDGTHLYSGAGPYNVTLQVTSANGCVDDSVLAFNNLFPKPTAGISAGAENCFNTITPFTSTSNGQGSTVAGWFWNYGDGSAVAAAQNPNYTYSVADTFVVKHWIRTDKGCYSDTANHSIIINPLPLPGFRNSTILCATRAFTITDTSKALVGNIIKWTWNFGDGRPDSVVTNANPFDIVYNQVGTYTITLNVETDKGCRNPIPFTKTITINAQPLAGFISPEVCLTDASAVFVDTSSVAGSTITQWAWNFGDPSSGAANTATVQFPQHRYNAIGSYTANLTVTTAQGCSASIGQSFTVNGDIPVARVFNAGSTFCSTDSIAIRDSSTVNFGSVTKVVITWDFVGAPSVIETDDLPQLGRIYKHKYPVFQSPLVQTYRIRYQAYSGASCVDEKFINIPVNANPKVQFLTVPDICLDAVSTQITQASEIGGVPGTAIFSGSGINAAGLFNPSLVGPGTYPLKYIYTSTAGCQDSITGSIKVLQPPVPKFGISKPLCANGAIQFSDSSTSSVGAIVNWNWNFGDGTPVISNTANTTVSHTYPIAGNYNVVLQVTTSNGCKASSNPMVVAVKPNPVASFTYPANTCLPNAQVLFTNNSSIADGTENSFTYVWNFGDATSGTNNQSVSQNPTHTYNTVGPYQVKLTVTSGDKCVDDTIITVNRIRPEPIADFTSDSVSLCANQRVQFIDRSNGAGAAITEWNWNFGDGTVAGPGQVPPLHTYSVANTYAVTLQIKNAFGCTNTSLPKSFRVYPYPVISAGSDTVMLEGGEIRLNATAVGNNMQYLWTPSNYLNSPTLLNPTVTGLTDDITYTLRVIAQGGCTKQDDVFVKLLRAPVIPNTFTPNNDGINDTWIIQYLESYPKCRIQVFNRNGQLVHESNGYTPPGWDGNYKGKSVPFGTYYYVIEPGSGRKPLTGYVTIIK
ncbi:MAG: hypothetical protein RLY16_155 [Bacteroidota bacterium]